MPKKNLIQFHKFFAGFLALGGSSASFLAFYLAKNVGLAGSARGEGDIFLGITRDFA